MSNYTVPTQFPQTEVFVGWDPMMNTFFAHVMDLNKDEDDPAYDVLWVGTNPNEIHDLEQLLNCLLVLHIQIPVEMQTKLYADANG